MDGRLLWEVNGKQLLIREKFSLEELTNFIMDKLVESAAEIPATKKPTYQTVDKLSYRLGKAKTGYGKSNETIVGVVNRHPDGVTRKGIAREAQMPYASVGTLMPKLVRAGLVTRFWKVRGWKYYPISAKAGVKFGKPKTRMKDVLVVLKGRKLFAGGIAEKLGVSLKDAAACLTHLHNAGLVVREKVDSPSSRQKVYLYSLPQQETPLAVSPSYIEAFIVNALVSKREIDGSDFAKFMEQYGVTGEAAMVFWREVFIPKFVAKLSPAYKAKVDFKSGDVVLIPQKT
jgi:hypothetical protein